MSSDICNMIKEMKKEKKKYRKKVQFIYDNIMNNFNNNNDEVDIQIRKFLKQVGVGSHQIIENELKTNSSSSSNICIKLEIDNKEIKKFETTIKK